MAVTAVSAAVSSFSGLRSLAVATGWPAWLAPLLPLTIDAYAVTATRVWLARSTRSARARRFARWNALLAVGLSLVGNGFWHLAEAGIVALGWPVVLAAGSVPPVVLGLLSHLAVLRGEDEPEPGTAAVPGRTPSQDTAGPEAEDSLLSAARAADAEYRATHDGRPITRDALRKALQVSTARAGEVMRELRKAPEVVNRQGL
ncbi:hypothetical protein KBI5_18630 [Frankia sp. KB5]|nr:hypothetical protein KBI5_18630 [Frankia sp. KB5]